MIEERDVQLVRCDELRAGDVLWPSARRVVQVIGCGPDGVVLALSYLSDEEKPDRKAHVVVFQPAACVQIARSER